MKIQVIDVALMRDEQRLISCVKIQDDKREGVDLKISFETYKLLKNTFKEDYDYAIQVFAIVRINMEELEKNDILDKKIIKFIESEFEELYPEQFNNYLEYLFKKPQIFFGSNINEKTAL